MYIFFKEKKMDVPDYFICPISCYIMKNPVNTSTGYIYEKSIIEKIINQTGICPFTRKKISRKVYPSINLKSLIQDFLEKNPEHKKDLYLEDFRTNIFHINSRIKQNPEILLEYDNIDLDLLYSKIEIERMKSVDEVPNFNEKIIKHIFDHSNLNTNIQVLLNLFIHNENIIKYIIDSVNDFNFTFSDGSLMPIHFICKYSSPEVIRYIIDKGIGLESETKDSWRPIHFICKHSNPEMIKYIIDKGVDLECETKRGWKPIHLICRWSTLEMIQYIIDKNVDLESETLYEGFKPIHIVAIRGNSDMIRYIFDRNVDLESAIKNGWKTVHLLCKWANLDIIQYIVDKGIIDLESRTLNEDLRPIHIATINTNFELVQYLISRGVNLEAEDNLKFRPIHYSCRFSTPEIIQYIIEQGVNLEAETINKWKPIHFICSFSTNKMIEYIINKNVDLVPLNLENNRPRDILKRGSKDRMIKYIDLKIREQNKIKYKKRHCHFLFF